MQNRWRALQFVEDFNEKELKSIDENIRELLKGEEKWNNWVATMKQIKSHKFAIHMKSFSYSDDSQYKRIDIHPGIERTTRKKIAPENKIPDFKLSELSRKERRLSEIFT